MKKSLLALALLLWMPLAQAADGAAGNVRYMSGVLVAQKPDGTLRVLRPKSAVHPGELLVTGEKSYAQVTMKDGTRMTLRPQSNLKIEAYQFKQETPVADNAVFRLLKGGFRTITGLIGKRGNPDAYRLRAAGATIGIRGTDFTARLCTGKGCADGEAAAPRPKAVGRVMRVQGELAAREKDGRSRKLILGSPVFEGDTLHSDIASYAVVVFRDGGRITLQASSVFRVEAFKYDKARGQENIALRLIKGGVRVVTGLIGRINHNNYKFRMSGATIGIRGTGFDAWCNGPCAEGAADFGANPENPLDGAGVYVWEGEVLLVGPGGSYTVALNQAAIIARRTGKPVRILTIPPALENNDAPRPDGVPVDLEKMFEEADTGGEAGLYVTVYDGHIILGRGDQQINLGKGESGFSNDRILARLAETPGFMQDDKLENLEQYDDSGGDQNGCVIR